MLRSDFIRAFGFRSASARLPYLFIYPNVMRSRPNREKGRAYHHASMEHSIGVWRPILSQSARMHPSFSPKFSSPLICFMDLDTEIEVPISCRMIHIYLFEPWSRRLIRLSCFLNVIVVF